MIPSQPNNPPTEFASAWMPLEGLIEQWGCFGSEATSVPALSATSLAFAALAQEMEAFSYRIELHRCPRGRQATNLESCLVALMQAWQQWSNAIHSLERLVPGEQKMGTADRDAIAALLTKTMEQRLRVSMLLQEVAREQLIFSGHRQSE